VAFSVVVDVRFVCLEEKKLLVLVLVLVLVLTWPLVPL